MADLMIARLQKLIGQWRTDATFLDDRTVHSTTMGTAENLLALHRCSVYIRCADELEAIAAESLKDLADLSKV